jgi:hypothetical protein
VSVVGKDVLGCGALSTFSVLREEVPQPNAQWARPNLKKQGGVTGQGRVVRSSALSFSRAVSVCPAFWLLPEQIEQSSARQDEMQPPAVKMHRRAPQVKDGKLRALAVMNKTRLPVLVRRLVRRLFPQQIAPQRPTPWLRMQSSTNRSHKSEFPPLVGK